eukprot:7385628-Prymnesium_polylepis.5
MIREDAAAVRAEDVARLDPHASGADHHAVGATADLALLDKEAVGIVTALANLVEHEGVAAAVLLLELDVHAGELHLLDATPSHLDRRAPHAKFRQVEQAVGCARRREPRLYFEEEH